MPDIRLVFVSDTHLGFDTPIRPRVDKLRRGPDFFNNFQWALDYARLNKVDLVVHGGDLFFRSKVHPAIVDRAYQMIHDFANSGIPILLVPGNHERSVLPPSLFLQNPNVHIFDRPRTYYFDIAGQRIAISGFPYTHRIREGFRDVWRACASDGAQPRNHHLLCMHHAVQGAVVGPTGFTFTNGHDVVAAKDIPGTIDLVLSGHIHRHQMLSCPTPVLFCGSVERTSFAEQHEAKGFCDIRLRAKAEPQVTFKELPTRPMVNFDGRGIEPQHMHAQFAQASRAWSADSIVRLQLPEYPNKELLARLSQCVPGILQLSCDSRYRGS